MALILLRFILLILGTETFAFANERLIHATKQKAFDDIVYPVMVDSSRHAQDGRNMILQNVDDVSKLLGLDNTGRSFQNVRDLLLDHGMGVLDKHSVYSIYEAAQFHETDKVFEILTSASSFSDFVNRAKIIRVYLNPGLYNYALRSAMVTPNDDDYNHDNLVKIPELFNVAARSFFTDEAIGKAIDRSHHRQININSPSFRLQKTSEKRLSYFTEDIGLNAFHHTIMLKTMRHLHAGEFINSRYNAERLALGLARVKPLNIVAMGAIDEVCILYYYYYYYLNV